MQGRRFQGRAVGQAGGRARRRARQATGSFQYVQLLGMLAVVLPDARLQGGQRLGVAALDGSARLGAAVLEALLSARESLASAGRVHLRGRTRMRPSPVLPGKLHTTFSSIRGENVGPGAKSRSTSVSVSDSAADRPEGAIFSHGDEVLGLGP